MSVDRVGVCMAATKATIQAGTVAQPVAAKLTRAAVFLVVTIDPGRENRTAVRAFCGDLAPLIRAVEFRDLDAGLSCLMGIGSVAWYRVFGDPRSQASEPMPITQESPASRS